MKIEVTEALEVSIEIFKSAMLEIVAPYYEALIVAFIILIFGGILATVSRSRVLFGITKFVAGFAVITIVLKSFGVYLI